MIYFNTTSLRLQKDEPQNISLSLSIGILRGICISLSETVMLFIIYSTIRNDGIFFFYDLVVNLCIAIYQKDYKMCILISFVHLLVGLVCGVTIRLLFFFEVFDHTILNQVGIYLKKPFLLTFINTDRYLSFFFKKK